MGRDRLSQRGARNHLEGRRRVVMKIGDCPRRTRSNDIHRLGARPAVNRADLYSARESTPYRRIRNPRLGALVTDEAGTRVSGEGRRRVLRAPAGIRRGIVVEQDRQCSSRAFDVRGGRGDRKASHAFLNVFELARGRRASAPLHRSAIRRRRRRWEAAICADRHGGPEKMPRPPHVADMAITSKEDFAEVRRDVDSARPHRAKYLPRICRFAHRRSSGDHR